jgi:ABC-2 type transport system ATP-binding protein
MSGSEPIIQASDLTKTFRLGFRRRKVEALRGVSFQVGRGEIFGFLGPNGAGKTTTIKIIVGLLRPTSGSCSLIGRPAGEIEARRHVGYLPESPYFYDNLLPDEFMDLCGRLRGLDAGTRRRRGDELIALVGLSEARDRPLRKFSKGMLQRIGLAQSMMSDPDLLILDEPMTGLDPVGRRSVRDLILDLHRAGKTIFFSSHILTDVESICHRVAIVNRGKVVAQGSLAELLSPTVRLVDIELADVEGELDESIAVGCQEVRRDGSTVTLTIRGEAEADRLLRRSLELNYKVRALTPRRETLENLFMRSALES